MSTNIANLVMRSTDKRLEGLSKEFGITYTRYVDDMSFSGNTIPENFIRLSKQIISQSGFTLNSDKEMMADAPKPKIVTGLSVSRKRPNVPRKIRREIRKEAYIFENFEAINMKEAERYRREQQIQGKTGYLCYINKGG